MYQNRYSRLVLIEMWTSSVKISKENAERINLQKYSKSFKTLNILHQWYCLLFWLKNSAVFETSSGYLYTLALIN